MQKIFKNPSVMDDNKKKSFELNKNNIYTERSEKKWVAISKKFGKSYRKNTPTLFSYRIG